MKNHKCIDNTCYDEIIYDFDSIEDLELLVNVGDAISVKFGEDGCVDIKKFCFSDYNTLKINRELGCKCFTCENTEDDVWNEYTKPMLAQAENLEQANAVLTTSKEILDMINRIDNSEHVAVLNGGVCVIFDNYSPNEGGWYAAIGCNKKN